RRGGRAQRVVAPRTGARADRPRGPRRLRERVSARALGRHAAARGDLPCAALDVMTRERMAFELQKIWAANRNTVLFVTHSITEAVLLSDTIVVMTPRPGRVRDIVKVDLPRPRDVSVLEHPRFVELSARVRNGIEMGSETTFTDAKLVSDPTS